jgi:antitoxin HicB
MTVDDYMKLPYPVIIVPESEGGFSTKVPDLPGCFSQGETVEEAYKNTREAMYNWISITLERNNLTVPEPQIY